MRPARVGTSARVSIVSLAVAVLVAATPAVRADEPRLSPDEIEKFLRDAKVIKSAQIGKGVTRPWRLTLQLGDITHDAAFQSVDRERDRIRFKSGREEIKFRDFYGYNIAAYRLARALGYDDLVPPSIERRWRGESGALTWWIHKKWDEDERLKANVSPPDQIDWEKQVYVARVFTALVEDTDRNLGNQLVTADFHIWLIDFTRAFRRSRVLEKTTIMRKIDRKFFDRLRTVTDGEITSAVKAHVDTDAVYALLARRTAIVEHFQKLAVERGEENVFF
jgi:hypothetical protein